MGTLEQNNNLKPCPFCGSEVKIAEYDTEEEYDDAMFEIECEVCQIPCLHVYGQRGQTKSDLIRIWNSRYNEQEVE